MILIHLYIDFFRDFILAWGSLRMYWFQPHLLLKLLILLVLVRNFLRLMLLVILWSHLLRLLNHLFRMKHFRMIMLLIIWVKMIRCILGVEYLNYLSIVVLLLLKFCLIKFTAYMSRTTITLLSLPWLRQFILQTFEILIKLPALRRFSQSFRGDVSTGHHPLVLLLPVYLGRCLV